MPRLALPGRTVLITGGASGIGAATARTLTDRGANVVIADHDETAAERLASTLPAGRALALVADVTDAGRMNEVVEATVGHFGQLDVVFANAGIAYPSTLAAADMERYERVIEVDLLGVVRTVKPALPQIIANRGHVLLTASIYAFVNGVVNSAYALSKAGVESLSRSLRAELATEGASAGVLMPGWVRTPLTDVVRGANEPATAIKDRLFRGPLGGFIEPEEVARAAVDGIERRSARIVVPKTWAAVAASRGPFNAASDRILEHDRGTQALIREIDRAARAEQDG
ncbi:SDR family NAD(P)-dependent oxidoreductase [Nocardioides daejeonensis]|uniref:SDR family NAD(P)-dependent oxidoreductase n=1 Tax=Nocardioides daejeonensis TaxID=1046556 RepID=UPI000D748553|nr:SDR family NAD(P)-dependent oxidoreductase [Nocardioides daejeonensis]